MRSRRNTFTYGDICSTSQSTQEQVPPIIGTSSTGTDDHHELVPYSKDWTVILRNQEAGQLVLYNTSNHRVSVRRLPPSEVSETTQALSSPNACVLCRRPFDMSPLSSNRPSEPDFMVRNYFRLLENSENSGSSTSSYQPFSSFGDFIPTTVIPEDPSTLSQSSFNQGYYQRFFIEEKQLGKGFRGSVYLCKHVLDNVPLGEYAIKKVAVGDNHTWLVKMLREVHLLEKLRHPNIVDYKHAWLEYHKLTNFGPEVPCLFILMECANGGNLEEYIEFKSQEGFEEPSLTPIERKLRARRMRNMNHNIHEESSSFNLSGPSKHYLNLQEIYSLFLDICKGLAHLHQHGILHRDLKPSNLLLQYNDDNRVGIPRVLISDFGECEILDQLTDRDRTGATGTLEFMAPELLKVDERGLYHKDYSSKSDMWSLGMVLYYLCYSRLPYRQIDDVDLLRQEIINFENITFPNNEASSSINYPNHKIPLQLRKLITRLLSSNPKNRPSCKEILESIESIGDTRTTFTTGESVPVSQKTSNISSMTDDIPQAPIPSVSVNENRLEPPKLVRIPSNNSTVSTVSSVEEVASTSSHFPTHQKMMSSSTENSSSSKVDMNLRQRIITRNHKILNSNNDDDIEREIMFESNPPIITNVSMNGNSTAIVRVTPSSRMPHFLRIICSHVSESSLKIIKLAIVLLKA
ncbi:8906_t:CDS:10 [Diversispora eburnea]|uniref:non-specific serine/threonine protein kinase n=1 Tax=Diversispora eburnea TaxID=1213867 RepID=A0A9N8Z5J6_9GLOM|nr:8906_t:CDS:10 [Diversispora eburnea]